MLERSQSFELLDKNFSDVQKIIENVLENNFSLSTFSKRLGRSLLRINYYDSKFEKEQQKDNRITILQEQGKRVYVQINGKLMNSQIERLWNELKKNFNISTREPKIIKKLSSKEETIQEIMDLIDKRGYFIKKEEVQTFIDNFMDEYNRLPKKDEFNSIVKGYIIMANEVKNSKVSDTNILSNENKIELVKTSRESDHNNKAIGSYGTKAVLINDRISRKRCPNCGNEGLIHEVDDKSVILLDYPRIYGKKNCCAECGYEWREH